MGTQVAVQPAVVPAAEGVPALLADINVLNTYTGDFL